MKSHKTRTAPDKILLQGVEKTSRRAARLSVSCLLGSFLVNNGLFQTDLKDRGASARIVDYPAAYRGQAAGILFADGHAEIKKRRDARTAPPLSRNGLIPLNVAWPNNPDVAWL